jgi:hypothetical protein
MKIESILESWEQDVSIDHTALGTEALKIPKLHHKYNTMLVQERLILRKYKADMAQLDKDKFEFYTQGPSEEQAKLGWELPGRGMILKNDIPVYMKADKQIVELSLRIGLQEEKVELLTSIMWSLKDRTYSLRVALDHLRFTMGG